MTKATIKRSVKTTFHSFNRNASSVAYELFLMGGFEICHSSLEATGWWDGLIQHNLPVLMIVFVIVSWFKHLDNKAEAPEGATAEAE